VKRHNIQESIYGVDIDASAIDIARLRLWLSLVVDEEDFDTIEALPNLDYKIVCGNTLVGFPNDWNSPAFERIEKLKNKFFAETDSEIKRKYKKEIDSEIKDRLATSKQVLGYQVDFDFKLFFSEVWRENGGFDIVIGNPPYISTKGTSTEDKRIFEKIYDFADDTYNHFFFKGMPLLSVNGSLTYITPKTFWTTQTKKNLRNLILQKQILYVFDTANPFSAAMVDTCITSVASKNPENHRIKFLDGSKDLIHPVQYSIEQSVYLNTQNSVIFKPTDENLKIQKLYGQKVKDLYNKWWNKIKTSRDIEINKAELATYRKSLKPGDVALLGCLTEGGQGLATANNGKYIAVRKSTKWAKNILESRPKKLAEAIKAKKIVIPEMADFTNTMDYLASLSEKEIAVLFDNLKNEYGRDIFGQGYLYRLIDDDEIADVDTLTTDEKENGIDSSKKHYVPYDKGDKDGNRWYLETPFAIEWTQENVGFLKADSGKKGEGMPVVRNPQFYFKEGFCWTNILNPQARLLKAKLKTKSVNDVGSMSLCSTVGFVPNYFIVILLNSELLFDYYREYINCTVNIQINDIRQLPIRIPTNEQLQTCKPLFDKAILLKQSVFNNNAYKEDIEQELLEIEKKFNEFVNNLYYPI
jgi:hypothetical protein